MNMNINSKKLLFIYGSNYGSTTEVAERITHKLKDSGFTVDLYNLKNYGKKLPSFNFDDYDGFIIGSAIYAGQWSSDMKRFLGKKSQAFLNKPLAAFAVCGEVRDTTRIPSAETNYIINYLKKWNITPDINKTLAGVVDISKTSKYGFFLKFIVKSINRKDPLVEKNKRNDFRDWIQIEDFADKLADLFLKPEEILIKAV